jgi:hypothetical protein
VTSIPIVTRFAWFAQPTSILEGLRATRRGQQQRPALNNLLHHPELLPGFVTASPVAMRYLDLLGPLAWSQFPERNLHWPVNATIVPYAALAAACLVKLDQHLSCMGQLRQFLVEHPALVWAFSFPLSSSKRYPWRFDANASLPSTRHFTRMLRQMPNQALQFLLDSSVSLLEVELAELGILLGETVSLDTKHILAWVKENNLKTYIEDRYDKNNQPNGDPDCRLGCKRRRNQRASSKQPPPTPSDEPLPADTVSVGEYYWGYASGVVATKVPGWGEFVLAELTQPFDRSDVSYFFPLMKETERRLGRQPSFGALDAAYDAFYVHEYFVQAGGFAAVPWADRADHRKQFDDEGLPLCDAGLPMPLKSTFMRKSHCLVPHECGRYVCPLTNAGAQSCPVDHAKWAQGGCSTTLPLSPGARARHELDRDSQAYKQIYKERTATERINSQAKALGIERPKLRNGTAIANSNTLIYVLINLRALRRIRQRKEELSRNSSSA